MFVIVALAVVLGGVSQRVAGLGFALVAAPLLVLLFDPLTAVIIVNLCGWVSAISVWLRLRADVDWKRYAWLASAGLVGIIPGTWILIVLPRSVLEISIGALLLVVLTLALITDHMDKGVDSASTRLISGLSSGFMSSSAGVGGPALAVYAVLSRWSHRSFAATLQPFFLTITSASLVSKWVMAGDSWPRFEWWLWLAILVCLLGGLFIGDRLARYVNAQLARLVVIVIAYGGAGAAIAKGVMG